MKSIAQTFKQFFGESPERETARALYIALVSGARNPFFYKDAGVPDTLDGRFDLIVLHIFLLLQRLGHPPSDALHARLGQHVSEIFIEDMDRSLREMGVGDIGVSKRIRAMSEALYGRINAYDEAFAGTRDLKDALRTNVYGKETPSDAMLELLHGYVMRNHEHLKTQESMTLQSGSITFVP